MVTRNRETWLRHHTVARSEQRTQNARLAFHYFTTPDPLERTSLLTQLLPPVNKLTVCHFPLIPSNTYYILPQFELLETLQV